MDRSVDFWGHGAQFISVFFMKANISEPDVFFIITGLRLKGDRKIHIFQNFALNCSRLGQEFISIKLEISRTQKNLKGNKKSMLANGRY